MSRVEELEQQLAELQAKHTELQAKYDDLNDFSKSQCAKLLEKNFEQEKQIERMKRCDNCLDIETSITVEPCMSCKKYNKWRDIV